MKNKKIIEKLEIENRNLNTKIEEFENQMVIINVMILEEIVKREFPKHSIERISFHTYINSYKFELIDKKQDKKEIVFECEYLNSLLDTRIFLEKLIQGKQNEK